VRGIVVKLWALIRNKNTQLARFFPISLSERS
jgi:hypothetical protein